MYHSITIGGKNTWDDWRLVPASRPVFNPPAQKVKTLEIPGGDGVIDLSQSLTGYPVYQNRTGSIEFIVMNDFKPWHMAYSDIMDYLHGQKLRAVLEDDPEYFYEGRFTVNVWKSEKDWSRITIDYDVGPYKWSVLSSTDDWLWDPFNFQNGVIRPAVFKDIAVTTEVRAVKLAALLFGRAPVCPVFRVSSSDKRGVHIRFINPTLGLDAVSYTHLEFIHLGENVGEGLAIGVNNSIVPAAQAASGMIDEVIAVSEKGVDAFEDWINEKQYYGELSLMDELAGWENLQKKYRAGSEERMKIDREVYRVQNELVSATYQASLNLSLIHI